jgi:hypothetical protein
VIFLALLLLCLPIKRLLQVYLHVASVILILIAHYMSSQYVQLEREDGGDVQLDTFVKLERHGFHFLAQVVNK